MCGEVKRVKIKNLKHGMKVRSKLFGEITLGSSFTCPFKGHPEPQKNFCWQHNYAYITWFKNYWRGCCKLLLLDEGEVEVLSC